MVRDEFSSPAEKLSGVRKWIFLALLAGQASALTSYPSTVEPCKPSDENWAALWEGCNLGCALSWTMASSSSLKPQGKNRYGAELVSDGKAETAWVEGAPGDGRGEWLECRFAKGPDNVGFSGATFVIGYLKNAETWKENSRPRQMRMEIDGKPAAILDFKDVPQPQNFNFQGLHVHSRGKVRFVITQVWPGSKYADTAITEMVLNGAH